MGIKGEKDRGQTARQPRNTRQQQDTKAEGREEGRQTATRLGSGGGNKEENGSRQGAGREQEENRQTEKKEIYKYLRERRGEKNAAETRKSMQTCVYTYHLISWRGGCLLHFLLYIYREYIIYIYIYNILPINVYFSFKVNGIKILHYYIWIDNVYFTIRICVFVSPDRLLRGFYTAFVCFVCVCDVHHIDKRGLCMLLAGGRGDSGQGYPLPLLGQSDG